MTAKLTDMEIARAFERIVIDVREILRLERWLAAQCGEQATGEDIADTILNVMEDVKAVTDEALARATP
ncbi:hypothetical protein EN851_27120 [Mesorhizobium sp. M8A.F.Ca.ET.208.01.1.1]|uniref:hypothetical protein n=1 Tax=unclassified Mesorhizobium TaxID=325217 RepID=UPI001093F410|nr:MULTISPECIES: hypothetical protein [unclassified Mesorhizobium]TGQ87694.1 hypothetical protein EN851_27120 [Mesorhizobium sp. M8A.F.Ca.ET.208.01.1.1]TGT49424.1 hypothetical protein EN810_27020 [Mesorhizobium sp. M8A.F.Ca.ET.167.01.1.1]